MLATPAPVLSSARQKKTKLGIVKFSYSIRLKAEQAGHIKGQPAIRMAGELGDPLNFLEHCHQAGAGGVQMDIGVREQTYIGRLREKAEAYGMFVEGSAGLPADQSDVERYEAVVRTARHAGAKVICVAIGGRRYEQFDKAEQFKAFKERSWKSVQLAEPVAAKHRICLAIENHKDWRVPEMLDMLNHISSEYIGVCVDTGNSFALLEDPMAVVEAYAPYAFATHLKDMAVAEYEDGFLLADVPLGQGLLDLPRMTQILRKGRPEINPPDVRRINPPDARRINFSLEMATRDPLKVPCLTQKYWATFKDVAGYDLARTLRYVRANACGTGFQPVKHGQDGRATDLPRVSHLPLNEQIRLEEDNIERSLDFAGERLNL